MGEKVLSFLVGLLYENGSPSLTRTLAITGWLAFLVGSAYLILTGQRWDNYETFATFTAGGGAATQVANKLIMNKYGSAEGQPYVKGGNQNVG